MKLPEGIEPICITWVDTCTTSGWQEEYDPSALICYTIGHLLEITKDTIVVCQNINAGQVGDVTRIPKGCIKEVIELGARRKKVKGD